MRNNVIIPWFLPWIDKKINGIGDLDKNKHFRHHMIYTNVIWYRVCFQFREPISPIFSDFDLICCCSVTQLCPPLCDPRDGSTPGFLVFNYLPEFAQTHVHWVSDDIQPSNPLLPASPTVSHSIQRVFTKQTLLYVVTIYYYNYSIWIWIFYMKNI